MSNFTTYPRQNAFESSLASDIDASVTTILLNQPPSFSLTGGAVCWAVIDYDNNKREPVKITGISGSTLTLAGRGEPNYEGGGSTAVDHAGGAKIIITDNWNTWLEIAQAIESKADIAGQTFTGPVGFSGATNRGVTVASLTVAQRDALSAPPDGTIIYNSDSGEFEKRQGGSWLVIDTGGTFPNASTTVAGKVEQATDTEVGASTELGATGAPLFINPDSVVKTSAGAGDENKLAALDSAGKFATGFMPILTQLKDTLTTKGDVYAATSANTVTRLGVGSDRQILRANAAQASGLEYQGIRPLCGTEWSDYFTFPLTQGFFTTVANTVSSTCIGLVGSDSNNKHIAGLEGGAMQRSIIGSTTSIDDFILEFVAQFNDGGANVDINMGIGDLADLTRAYDNTTSGRCLMVGLDGSTNQLYTRVKTTTTITNTLILDPVVMDQRYAIRIHYTPTEVRFFVDNALAATVTTNIPSTLSNLYIGAGDVEVSATGSSHGFKMYAPTLSVRWA